MILCAMRMGVIGCGRMGRAVANCWAQLGHKVMVGSRDIRRARGQLQILSADLLCGSYKDAAAFGEVLLLATIWQETQAALESAAVFDSKILIDATNPKEPQGHGLCVGHTDSGGEQVARWAQGARVVKAFNHIYDSALAAGLRFPEGPMTLFYCGDHADSKSTVAGIIREMGAEAIDAGPLRCARYLEPLAGLWIQLCRVQGMDQSAIALRLMRR